MEKQIKKEVSQSKYSRIDSTCPILSSPANPQTSEQQPALAFTKNFEKYEVISKNENIQKELKCIEWRSKTELPIVKILFYKLLCSKIINCFVVQIGIQKFTSSLQALPTLPFYQVVYLLKESMVGFQRLFDRFGSFEVNGKMVFINKLGRCKVWFNQNVTLNYPSKKVKISQIDFKNQIVKIFEEKCISSTLSRDLFDKLKKAEKLIETINLIEYFSMEKKLMPPNKITAMYGSLGAKRISNENGTQDFTLSKSLLQKPPQFIKDIREKANLKTRKYTDCSIKSVIVKKTISTRNITEETPKSSHNATNPQSTCERKSSVERNVEEKSLKSEEAKGKLKLFKHTKNSLSANIISANAPAKQIGQPKNNSSKQANFVQPGQALHRTKIQKSQQPFKLRKFSQNVESLKTRTFLQRDTNEKQKPKEAMEKQKEEPKEEKCKTKMIVSEPMNELRFTFSQKNQVAAKQIYESTPQYNLLNRYGIQNHEDLIIKNGWLKRINSLTLQSFRDTVNSISDGNETLADHLTLPHIELELLKNMGKELRGSLLINAE